jgi:hypothetical protein
MAAGTIVAASSLQATGTVYFASGTVFIGMPTADIDTTDLDTRISINYALIMQNAAAISDLSLGEYSKIIYVTDTVTSGGTFWQWEFPDWDQTDSVYYDKRWRERPTITIGYGGEFTQYGIQLPGVTTGSDRGVRVNLSSGNSFSDSWEIRLFGVLEAAGGTIYPVAVEGFGLMPPSRPATRRITRFLGR